VHFDQEKTEMPTLLYPKQVTLSYYATHCNSATCVLQKLKWVVTVVNVAMVLGSIPGADTMFFGAEEKFYWIAGYLIAIRASPDVKYTPITLGVWRIGSVILLHVYTLPGSNPGASDCLF
jgi:hypothetical protein